MLHLTIEGRIPSKKNSLRRIKRGNRIFTVPSAQHEAWVKVAGHQVHLQLMQKKFGPPIEKAETIEMALWAPDARGADLSNKFESIADLLVHMAVLKDDNWNVCPDVRLVYRGIDRERPRVEIIINGKHSTEGNSKITSGYD